MLPATSSASSLGGNMNTVATRFQVTMAGAAVAAAAVFTPIAANAAPAVQLPAAPVSQMVGNIAEAPGDFLYATQVASLQLVGGVIRFRSFALDSRAQRLQAYATLHPGTFFGQQAAATAQRLLQRRAAFGDTSYSACRGGTGIKVGPYGTVTAGPC